jgi:hypothetical protein
MLQQQQEDQLQDHAGSLPRLDGLQTHGINNAHRQQQQGVSDTSYISPPMAVHSITVTTTPSLVTDVYNTLHRSTQLRPASTAVSLYASNPESPPDAEPPEAVVESITQEFPNANLTSTRSIPPITAGTTTTIPIEDTTTEHLSTVPSPWIFIREYMAASCCGCFFRERRVWLIEISLREYQLDEYVVAVPSPVYCDYRLPEYGDVVMAAPTTTAAIVLASANSSRQGVNQQLGEPPAYESESDRDSDDDDNDDNSDNDYVSGQDQPGVNSNAETQEQNSVSIESCVILPIQISRESNHGASSSGGVTQQQQQQQQQQQMTMISRHTGELTSVVMLMSSMPSSTSIVQAGCSSTSGDRVCAGDTRS